MSARARLRQSPSTARPGLLQWRRLLPTRCLRSATRPWAVGQELFREDPGRAEAAHGHLRDGENGSAATPVRASKPRPCWYRIPMEESDGKKARSKSQLFLV